MPVRVGNMEVIFWYPCLQERGGMGAVQNKSNLSAAVIDRGRIAPVSDRPACPEELVPKLVPEGPRQN